MYGNFANIIPHADVRQRAPPAPATPVKLPSHPPREALGIATHTAQEISELFLKIHKTGPTIRHVQALNICSVTEAALEQLVPKDHLPSTSWRQDPSTSGGSNVFPASLPVTPILSNGSPVPGHDVYFIRAKELSFDNEDAFRAIERKPALPGRPTIRVAHFRKFWDGLSQMADYWDTSLDEYRNNDAATDQEAMDIDQLRTDADSAERGDADKSSKKPDYVGRRIGTGKDMPPRHRDDVVFAFVEAIASAFRCKVEKPRMEPKIKLHNLFIPLPQTGNVYRYPRDSQQARRGVLEGPLMGMQCTNQTVFCRPEEASGEGQGESANLLREVGVMLSIANKRSREGQTEPDSRAGKWWVSKPRWGGGPGGETGILEESQDAKEPEPKLSSSCAPGLADEGKKTTCEPQPPIRRGGSDRFLRKQEPGSSKEDCEGSAKGRKRTKRSNAVESWKTLQPAQSTWDKNVVYKQIGKPKSATCDDIYIVSALYHHVSIVHLRVHPRYLEYINTSAPPLDFVPGRQPWYVLDVRRSKWFDLFVPDDRTQAMRGVWGVMSYLMRDMRAEGS
ncbi:hypothetical protein MMC07_009340 [Pseudocyphellaria aurata]|nr:hypothetical protein [Pseudocyphellaria aurata]